MCFSPGSWLVKAMTKSPAAHWNARLVLLCWSAVTSPAGGGGPSMRSYPAGFVGLDDPERASAETMAAFDLATTHGLKMNLDELRELRTSFPPDWPPSLMAELDERLGLA
jgi:hypothetical protein